MPVISSSGEGHPGVGHAALGIAHDQPRVIELVLRECRGWSEEHPSQ